MPEIKTRILFVCIHNSGRSQMAEAFVNHGGNDRFVAESAGLEAGALNPRVVESMAEIGIDISGKTTKTVAEMLSRGMAFDYVVTVCDAARAERCPVFPGRGQRRHWDIPDPAAVQGTPEERRRRVGEIREEIRQSVLALLRDITGGADGNIE